MRPTLELALAIFALVGIDAAACAAIRFTVTGLPFVNAEIILLVAICAVYFSFRGDGRLLEMAIYVVLWAVFSLAAAVFTYVCAAWSFPLRDDVLVACDRALHFNLHAFTVALSTFPLTYLILQVAYASLVVQIAASILLFAHWRVPFGNARLLAASVISLLVTAVLSGLLPALDPVPSENPAMSLPVVHDLLAMRAGGFIVRNIDDIQGIIAFPSFHTVLAIIITWAHRRLSSFWPVAVLNGLMLASIPSVGNHYAADMLGAVPVAMVAIVVTNLWLFGARIQLRAARHGIAGRSHEGA